MTAVTAGWATNNDGSAVKLTLSHISIRMEMRHELLPGKNFYHIFVHCCFSTEEWLFANSFYFQFLKQQWPPTAIIWHQRAAWGCFRKILSFGTIKYTISHDRIILIWRSDASLRVVPKLHRDTGDCGISRMGANLDFITDLIKK